jgi:hypothetical protein
VPGLSLQDRQPPSAGPRQKAARPIRARALAALLLLVPVVVWYQAWGSWRDGGNGGAGPLVGWAVAFLALSTVANAGLRRRRPAWSLSPGELVTVYVSLAIVMAMTDSVWGYMGALVQLLPYPVWQATPANEWVSIIWPNLPRGLTVSDPSLLDGFFLGDSTFYQRAVMRAWAGPAMWWTCWAVALMWVTLCLSVVVRRRWSRDEQLPFPMTILPLQLTDPEARLLTNRLWWIGVSAAAGIGLLNFLGGLFPTLPTIPMTADISKFFANNRPWDGLRTPELDWYPGDVGISYLMPVDFGFSLIVFNLLWRALYVTLRQAGWGDSYGAPYADEQTIGSVFALFGVLVWLDRRYLLQVVRKAIGLRSYADDGGDAFGYRTAVFGAAGGFAFLLWFMVRGGLPLRIGALTLGCFFASTMVISRMRVQVDPPDQQVRAPTWVLNWFPGTGTFGPRGVVMNTFIAPFTGSGTPAPTQLEALRMAERAGFTARTLAWAMMAVIPLMMACYFWSNLHYGYSYGLGAKAGRALNFVPWQYTTRIASAIRDPAGPDWTTGGMTAIGGAVTALLMFLKLRFPGFPVHPMALPISYCYSTDAMLPAIFAAWLVKVLLLRYGGLRAHRRALPFFLGLIVGSAVTSLLSTLALRLAL